jgi:ADP-heptose:LPS heptosyltransferase
LRKVAVFFPGALGDFICFLPALDILRQSSRVDLFARTEFGSITPPGVEVRSLDCFELRQLFVSETEENERPGQFYSAYDFVYSWTGSGHRDFVHRLERWTQGRARVYPFRPGGVWMHQADYYCFCLNRVANGQHIAKVVPRPDATAWCAEYWARHALGKKSVLALGPGSGAKEKNWPATYFSAVARWWRDATHGVVVVLLGPVEEDRGGLAAHFEDVLIERDLKLAQVAALIARSQLYLGNDSGLTHLAASVGARTVALFGPSDWRWWSPRGARVTILRRETKCSPCQLSVMKQCSHRKCLNDLAPQQVIKELEKLPEVSALTRGGVGIRV